jgi:hypothetical protein
MHFKFPLLAGLILVLSVDALPWTRTNSRSGIVILPLKHVEQRSDIHPLIVSVVLIPLQDLYGDRLRRLTNKISIAANGAMRE